MKWKLRATKFFPYDIPVLCDFSATGFEGYVDNIAVDEVGFVVPSDDKRAWEAMSHVMIAQ
jgi:hypothetical protein